MTSGLHLVQIGETQPDQADLISDLILSWHDDCCAFAKESFPHDPAGNPVVIDSEQARILTALQEHDRVAVRTGRGVGKTCAAAILVHWFLSTRFPAIVVTSAGTWGHLEDKLWPEIHNWGHAWLLKDYFEYQVLGIYNKRRPSALRAEASSSDKAENVEGFHSPHLLLLIDEAKAMPDEVFSALMASLTAAGVGEEQKVIALSTPPLTAVGWFARVSTSPDWHVVHISGLDSPRVSKVWVSEIERDWGKESPQYQSYVLGEIPDAVSDVLIRRSWVEAAQALQANENDTRPPVMTCDVAREGEDLTVIGIIQQAAYNLAYDDDELRFGWYSEPDLMMTCSRLTRAAYKYHPAALLIDDGGLGGGVTDRLRQKQSEGTFPATCSILPVKFGSKPEREDRFKQRKDELWWSTREAIRQSKIALPSDETIRSWKLPRGSDLKTQLISPLIAYANDTDLIDILDKRVTGGRHAEKTKNLPSKSPDLAHALILGVRYYLRQSMAEPSRIPKELRGTGEALLLTKIQGAVDRASRRSSDPNPYRR